MHLDRKGLNPIADTRSLNGGFARVTNMTDQEASAPLGDPSGITKSKNLLFLRRHTLKKGPGALVGDPPGEPDQCRSVQDHGNYMSHEALHLTHSKDLRHLLTYMKCVLRCTVFYDM